MARRTIPLKGEYLQKEIVATGAITPGHGVSLAGTVAGAGSGRKAFAMENDLIGKGIDDAYAIGETVRYACFPNGCEVLAWLAPGQTIAVGASLEFNASGELIALASGVRIGYALEAVTTTGTRARISIEIA